MTAPAPAPLTGVLEIVAAVRDGLVDAEDLVDQIVTACDRTLDQLPGWLVGDARAKVADLQRRSAQAIAEVRAWLATAGDPTALELAASAWDEEVAGPVSTLVPLGAAERPELSSSWTGDAAEAYLAVLPAQGTALEAIQATAGDVRAALIDFAIAVRAFWTAIDKAVIAALVGLATGVGTAITGVGAIFGVLLALGTIAAFSTSVGEAISGFDAFTAAATSHSSELAARIHDNAGFGGVEWPRSTTDLFADGSISDGDDTDWHVG